jgi:hypothetical protein
MVQRDLNHHAGTAALLAEYVQPTAVLRHALGQPAQPTTVRVGAAHAIVGHLNTQAVRFGNGTEPDPSRPRVLQRVRDRLRGGEPGRDGDVAVDVAIEAHASFDAR